MRNIKIEGWDYLPLSRLCKQDRVIVEYSSANAQTLPYLSLENIESNTGRIMKNNEIVSENEGISTTFLFGKEHVLYGKLRPYLNKVSLPDFNGRCTTEIIPLKPEKNVDRQYLAWLLRRKETVEYAMQGKTGSRMPRADMDELLKLIVPLPPLPEQKRIAALLNEQTAAVEKARKAAEEQIKTILIVQPNYLKSLLSYFNINKCTRKKIGEVSYVVNGYGFPEYLQGRNNLPFAFIKVSDMNEIGSEIYVRRASNTVDNTILDIIKAKTYPSGTVIFPKVGGALLTNKKRIMAVEGSFDNNIMGLVPYNVESEWLYFCMLNIDLVKYANIQALPSIKQSTVEKIEIPVPDKTKQQEIITTTKKYLNYIDRSKFLMQDQMNLIRKMPMVLLNKAFGGVR